MADSVFHKDFKSMPWWWEWWHPTNELSQDPPRKTDVLVVGAGYGGLSTALELARSGVEVTVLERGEFGVGASTRNGGGVSGGTTLGKGFSGKGVKSDPEEWKKIMTRMLADAADSLAQVQTVIEREGIECHWRMSGRFSGAFTPRYYAEQAAKVGTYNASAGLGTYMIPREQQREEIASDYYYGGMVVERTGQLHPALYYGGLLKAAHRAGAKLCAQCDAEKIERKPGGFTILTSKGPIEAREVVIATNGYTGDVTPTLKRRLIPVASHIIATEELPEDLVKSLIPKGRVVSDTKRVLCYYRQSPDSKRVIFGGRARFTQVSPEVSAPVLHGYMLERWPQLKGTKVTHAWTRQRGLCLRLPAAHGHGAGHALSHGLQRLGRGDDVLSRLPDGAKDRRWLERADQRLRRPGVSDGAALFRQSLVFAHGRRLVQDA